MTENVKGNGIYYSGGLAELVSSPSILTYSFLAEWFTGTSSLGRAMQLLHLPYSKISIPVIELYEDELFVNLLAEELTLYQDTLFSYKLQKDSHKTPELKVDIVKMVNPFCIFHTAKILLAQSQWIAKPHQVVLNAEKWVKEIPQESVNGLREIDQLLSEKVWPYVLAVGVLSEFYNQYVSKEAKNNVSSANNYISSIVSKDDWFFKSISDQGRVKNGEMSFQDYINLYGIRADKDYELATSRWHEMQDVIKKRIEDYSQNNSPNELDGANFSSQLKSLFETAASLQVLRSEAKRKALIHIDALRKNILGMTYSIKDIRLITKNDIITGNFSGVISALDKGQVNEDVSNFTASSGKGVCVSQGEEEGIIKNISDNNVVIPEGTIGVFPNASPEFAIQYPKCKGMIFLRGGQTSHGAIVAREFGIPAIVESTIKGIQDGVKIKLNATSGEWMLL